MTARTTATAIALAGGAASATLAQDTRFTVQETTEANRFVIAAEFLGSLPAGVTRLDVAWSDVNIELSGDAPITFDAWNPGYNNGLIGGPDRADAGVNPAGFTGVMFGTELSNIFNGPAPDSSNPLLAVSFTYGGSLAALDAKLVGQNSIVFTGGPLGAPFGFIEFYQNAQGVAGTRSFEFAFAPGRLPVEELDFFVPSPATLALAPIALAAARRRRK
ncbi:MAG: hypothetical protein AAFN41_01420 [Planctomycetota bacterium]